MTSVQIEDEKKQLLLRMSQDAEDGTPDIYWKPRPAMNQEEFDAKFGYESPPRATPIKSFGKQCVTECCGPFFSITNFINAALSFIPIIQWLPKYSIKQNFVADVIGGLTVGIMHVPQGIAYASLALVSPVVGLYMSFLAPLFYMVFGTSRHTSLGSFAVISLMSGMAAERLLRKYNSVPTDASNSTSLAESSGTTVGFWQEELTAPTYVEIASVLTFTIGFFHILMAAFRLEFIATYFSDQVVAGFTTGASLHVFVAQLKEVFAVGRLPKRSGFGQLFLQLYDMASGITRVNLYTLLISALSIIILVIGKELINPFIKKKRWSVVPIPFELILIIIATVFSAVFDFHGGAQVRIVDHIPTGMPSPNLPSLHLVGSLLIDSVEIGMVIVAVHISMAKMFAKKKGYKIEAGQELYAIGLTSVLSSFFPVYPIACSLGRTVTNVDIGTKTQLSSLFSSGLLIAIILYFGQYLSALPMCVLSAIIIVALTGMFKKFADLKRLWPISKVDFSIWLVSFLGTTVYDVKEGLAISIAYALLTTVFRTQWSHWHLLSNLQDTNDYRDSERYHNVINFERIIVFRFDSPLLFTNVERFKEVIHQTLNEWRASSPAASIDYCSVNKLILPKNGDLVDSGSVRNAGKIRPQDSTDSRLSLHFIIDCSGFTFVDYMGVNALKEIFAEMRSEGVLVYFASAKAPVREMFGCSGFFKFVPKENFYPTIRDAVNIARQRQDALTTEVQPEQAEQHDSLQEIISRQPMD